MKVAVVHHHLKPGGVTRIIESQLKALSLDKSPSELTLVVGEAPHEFSSYADHMQIFEGLDYLTSNDHLNERLEQVNMFFRKIPEDVILHVHNLNLGKNPVITYAVYLEALNGRKVLNHCHDFAEDRPENYKFIKKVIKDHFGKDHKKILYPAMDNYRFAVINRADFERLNEYGVPEDRITFLENPVSIPSYESIGSPRKAEIKASFGAENKQLVVYPVRGIRRKNLGEFILLAAIFADEAEWITTLPPQNPIEQKEYNLWKKFCSDNNIRVHFEAGQKFSFNEIMLSADRCISTSIKEGFGMAFLEPWLFFKPVIGRYLPQVCKDFHGYGIKFPVMYEHLITPSGKDFAELSVEDKMDFILSVIKDKDTKTEFFVQNPQLELLLKKVPDKLIENNIQRITANYSLKSYGEKLRAIYKKFP